MSSSQPARVAPHFVKNATRFIQATASKQAQLLRGGLRRLELTRRKLGACLVETELVAGDLEAAADHPGDRPAAGHALAKGRVVVLAAAGLADELEHMAVAVGKIGHQPFAEQV